MSYIKRFVEDLAVEYQEKHPGTSWEKAMEAVCNSETPLRPKGFLTAFGYKGLINGRYQLFATEQEYKEALCNA